MAHTYRWINGVAILDNKETLLVNYLSLSIWNEEQNKLIFYNTWITNKPISSDTVALLASCGRTRWKIENAHTNVLMYSILDVSDEDYQKARRLAGRRDEFFNKLRFLMRYKLFESWEYCIAFYSRQKQRAIKSGRRNKKTREEFTPKLQVQCG